MSFQRDLGLPLIIQDLLIRFILFSKPNLTLGDSVSTRLHCKFLGGRSVFSINHYLCYQCSDPGRVFYRRITLFSNRRFSLFIQIGCKLGQVHCFKRGLPNLFIYSSGEGGKPHPAIEFTSLTPMELSGIIILDGNTGATQSQRSSGLIYNKCSSVINIILS